MADFDFDLFVIGAGSGGVRASRIAANLGARAAVAEEYRVGGTCVVRGCIPKKMLVFAAHFAEDFEDAANYGWSMAPATFDWSKLIANKDKEIDRLNGLYLKTLAGAGVEVFECRAVLEDRHTVRLADGRRVTAETILVATGGAPWFPDFPGADHVITSNEAFHLSKRPDTILIAGGGYIAVEFAGIFNGLGCETTLIYRRDKILRGFDDDLRDTLEHELTTKGVRIIHNTIIDRIEGHGDRKRTHLASGQMHEYDHVMFATGRRPCTGGLGLEKLGVELEANGAIKVDEYSRSSVDNIYAVGDVTDRVNLTPVAIKEGHAFALTVYGDTPVSPEHDNVASAVFSQPPIGSVGLTEAEARDKHGEVDIYKSTFKPLKHTITGRDERAMIKMIVDPATDKVIGAHMIGPDAPEIIQGIAIAVKNGVTKAQFDRTIAIHPSSAEEFVLMPTPVAD